MIEKHKPNGWIHAASRRERQELDAISSAIDRLHNFSGLLTDDFTGYVSETEAPFGHHGLTPIIKFTHLLMDISPADLEDAPEGMRNFLADMSIAEGSEMTLSVSLSQPKSFVKLTEVVLFPPEFHAGDFALVHRAEGHHLNRPFRVIVSSNKILDSSDPAELRNISPKAAQFMEEYSNFERAGSSPKARKREMLVTLYQWAAIQVESRAKPQG